MISFILNLPWTLIGLVIALLSVPVRFSTSQKPFAVVIHVESFWWYAWLPGCKKIRAMALGHIALLGPRADEKDLTHELIHTEQFNRLPFILPFLSYWQSFKNGYRQNKYEAEAYDRSGSRYEGRDTNKV
jgi:hypothetical protein